MVAPVESKHGVVTNLLSAAAVGVLQLGVAISLAALIFQGPLSAGAGRAAAGFLLGTAIVSFIVGLSSRMTLAIAGAQDTAAIVLAAIAASIAAQPTLDASQQLATVTTMIAICAVLTGLTMLTIGRKRLTGFVRYLPYPVISGFTAGTGWLLFRGGVEVMHGAPLEFDTVAELANWSALKFLVPGLGLCVLIVVVLSSRISNTFVSVAILGGAVLFHVIGRGLSSAASLEADGWLVGPFPANTGWSPIGLEDLEATDWSVLIEHALPMGAVVAVSLVGLLLNLSGLESATGDEIDLDHEVAASGVANIGLAPILGLVGYHLIGDTLLARQLGGRGRSVPLVIAVMAAGAFVGGTDLIALMPRAVAGGVLAGLGLNLLTRWSVDSLGQMGGVDRALSGLILVTIAVLGVLQGVGAGILVAACVFIWKYSRVSPIYRSDSGQGRSNVDRTFAESVVLGDTPHAITTFELQGFLFFGSAVQLRRQIDDRVAALPKSDHQLFFVLDLERVTGIDSTAAAGLLNIQESLKSQGITLVWSVAGPIADALARTEVDNTRTFPDIDHAVAWCEDEMLEHAVDSQHHTTAALPDALIAIMERVHLESGETLMQTGGSDRNLYFIETGRLTAWTETGPERRVRIRTLSVGAAIGEIGFCTGEARTATVTADVASTVLALSRSRFEQIEQSDPRLAMLLQEELLGRLALRVKTTSAVVRRLLG